MCTIICTWIQFFDEQRWEVVPKHYSHKIYQSGYLSLDRSDLQNLSRYLVPKRAVTVTLCKSFLKNHGLKNVSFFINLT